VDPNFDTANDMAGVARRMAQDSGLEVEIEVHGDRRTALPKADAVILSAAVEGARRWTMDRDILVRHGLPDQTGECGGVGGLLYALRSATLAVAALRHKHGVPIPDIRLLLFGTATVVRRGVAPWA